MKGKCLGLLLGLLVTGMILHAQVPARLMRYVDVSETQICFVYGGDIWLVAKSGGTASQLTHSPGEESWPRFSPDGRQIAFTASYHGNPDIYVMPVTGGQPLRLTYVSFPDRMIDWHPDGQHILFASARESGPRSVSQFYMVPVGGGMPSKLKVPYGELASFSPDGKKLAYITKITENYPFKRYRGGLSSDIIVYDLEKDRAENITDNHAIDGKPAWVGDQIYFLSDRDANMRLNVWKYDTRNAQLSQLTKLSDFDINYMAAGPQDLVFEAGGTLYRMNLQDQRYMPVDVNVVSDLATELPRRVDVSRMIGNASLAPQAKRLVVQARGELFDLPVKDGYTLNLTNSSGAFDHSPAWSPDGKYLAYWSDQSGEYQIYLREAKGSGRARQLTHREKGFGYTLYWSPDSSRIAFIDETNTIQAVAVGSGQTTVIGNTRWHLGNGALSGYRVSWSPDSNWLAYTEKLENEHSALFLYDFKTGKALQASSGFYQDFGPVFSQCGRYLFYYTNRSMSALYSDMDDGTWIYANSTQIACMPLTLDAPSLLAPKNDMAAVKDKAEEGKTADNKKAQAKEEAKPQPAMIRVDGEAMEERIYLLPPKAGNFGPMFAFKGKLAFVRSPSSGSDERTVSLMYYDLDERKEECVIDGIDDVSISADGESILAQSGSRLGVIKLQPGQKLSEPIPMELSMNLVPREEWRQIFRDTWRRYRDFFYDPNMQGVDWPAMRTRYGALVEFARTRWDLTQICSDLVAEISAGHTYNFGGDAEAVQPLLTGFLGIDWEKSSNGYKVKRIVKPAPWDTRVRSPFDKTAVNVKVGDTIHAVNGIDLNPERDPYAAFEGLSAKTVTLLVSSDGNRAQARELIVNCLSPAEETELRNLEWIDNNRRMVDRLSGGRLGYIYMSNTSGKGQSELVRMFYGQLHKQGFVIDERFNGGGQLADRFLELLRRPVVYNLYWRNGQINTQPIRANNGPMGMLINGWAGSGGDGLPWAFQELKAGPIVGERTLGILVGPATGHQLIDGGGITVPDGRLYDNDGHWFWEGQGVQPDIEVWDDPNLMMNGRDPQIERLVDELVKLLQTKPGRKTPAPPLEDRTAAGLLRKK